MTTSTPWRRLLSGGITLTVAATLAGTMSSPSQASDTAGAPSATGIAHRPDNRPGPLTARQDKLRAKALAALQNGARHPARAQGRRRHGEAHGRPGGGARHGGR